MGSKPTKHNDKKDVVAPASRKPNRNVAASSSNSRPLDASSGSLPSDAAADQLSPERRGFNNPRPARRGTSNDRAQTRQTRMVGAEDMNGDREDLDERPFHQEKVNRVPTKALLKPPKNPNSLIADPDEEYELY
ncbi:hypothetical protein NESM_000358500 [Novymonas esmeraldas]|uniref:Uncharacterized protein n=1 Tax=Novymonas esmeraldas TaxID=1808958 RepID=A0AAW0EL71_9TRYP